MHFPKSPLAKSLLMAATAGVAYGFLTQLAARNMPKGSPKFEAAFIVMSLAYVFLLPTVIGMVHVFIRSAAQPLSLTRAFFEPFMPSALCLVLSLVVHWEGTICLIMALPIMLIFAGVGGLIMRFVLKSPSRNLIFATFVFLPIPLAYAEQSIPLPQEQQIVANSIIIAAPAATVWKKIVRVEKITEPQSSFFYTMGFPRPVQALLSGEGVGQTRLATFERGLTFVETVTAWRENEKLAFTIKVDPKATPLTTLDEHVTVGGAFFDVLSGTYEIEKLSGNEVRLKLYSEHRISTHFNFYARIWSRYLMSEIQANILKVIKARCET